MFHVPVHATKAYGGAEVYIYSFLTTTPDAGKYLPALSASPGGKGPHYLQSRGIAGETSSKLSLYLNYQLFNAETKRQSKHWMTNSLLPCLLSLNEFCYAGPSQFHMRRNTDATHSLCQRTNHNDWQNACQILQWLTEYDKKNCKFALFSFTQPTFHECASRLQIHNYMKYIFSSLYHPETSMF